MTFDPQYVHALEEDRLKAAPKLKYLAALDAYVQIEGHIMAKGVRAQKLRELVDLRKAAGL